MVILYVILPPPSTERGMSLKLHISVKKKSTSTYNKVRELATRCLPWQQWTETSVWFDDVGIPVSHSYVVVDLWQSLSEWRLLLSECVLVCCRENVEISC
jgi:hypothetical protein